MPLLLISNALFLFPFLLLLFPKASLYLEIKQGFHCYRPPWKRRANRIPMNGVVVGCCWLPLALRRQYRCTQYEPTLACPTSAPAAFARHLLSRTAAGYPAYRYQTAGPPLVSRSLASVGSRRLPESLQRARDSCPESTVQGIINQSHAGTGRCFECGSPS